MFYIPSEGGGRAHSSGFGEHVGTVVFGPKSASPATYNETEYTVYANNVAGVRFPGMNAADIVREVSADRRTVTFRAASGGRTYLKIKLIPDPVTGACSAAPELLSTPYLAAFSGGTVTAADGTVSPVAQVIDNRTHAYEGIKLAA